ncbi:dimethylamine/trimethylamine dehydrogenase [Mesorhizobium sp. NFR06]|uniref:oxidoreductase n=1 Tax=Mesorhizobium sp. NFR06 TaxID=1566290 RepID=UPI0008E963CD|nr:FAD-dependent oxidoreductase [Mesorhizobium sp. NFR06]SFP88417.1 dimethylamine/trimethylamine dehydrogenase [Mesorhizobium sp. NFR06]
MRCNPRYEILFEPVRIGPVTAPNRFYQTPHATGMGHQKPQSGAALRGIKAEGGWGVVSTEYCSIHPSSDDSPFGFLTLWDEDDVRDLARTADAIHAHGSLAAVELWHGGAHTNNRLTREQLLAPSAQPAKFVQPGGARAMDRQDINDFRRWQRQAAIRARRAGFDIVYCYAGHDYLPFQFLSRRTNRRTDEYGGTLENRVRLLREMIEDTKEAVGDSCAVAVRLAVDELHGPHGITHEGEGRDVVEMLAEVPDLWDVNIAGSLGNDSKSSRFSSEGFQEDYVGFVKRLTTKPVVSVGRFTSPDTMADQIRRGVQDFIGAARPSIADPFLPKKVFEGREDEIRECIGCNICRAANNESVPLRCTQNPTVGEEWRRGWHPEQVDAKRSEARVLVVGAGPAGLECALTLGRRGYGVMLAEAANTLGGRVSREATLPGLGAWARVRDHRLHMLTKQARVEIYPGSRLGAEDVLSLGVDHVVLATGSSWRRDGVGASIEMPVDFPASPSILTPDDIFAGAAVIGPVLVYDDEHYFMGGALAEKLRLAGHKVTIVTPLPVVSSWTQMTDEQFFVQKQLMEVGIDLLLSHSLTSATDGIAEFACAYTGRVTWREFGTLVLVTGRIADQALFDALCATTGSGESFPSITRIGDCLAPSSIADAVHSGHKFARCLDQPTEATMPLRERPFYSTGAKPWNALQHVADPVVPSAKSAASRSALGNS